LSVHPLGRSPRTSVARKDDYGTFPASFVDERQGFVDERRGFVDEQRGFVDEQRGFVDGREGFVDGRQGFGGEKPGPAIPLQLSQESVKQLLEPREYSRRQGTQALDAGDHKIPGGSANTTSSGSAPVTVHR
jgi:hypothetical protein